MRQNIDYGVFSAIMCPNNSSEDYCSWKYQPCAPACYEKCCNVSVCFDQCYEGCYPK